MLSILLTTVLIILAIAAFVFAGVAASDDTSDKAAVRGFVIAGVVLLLLGYASTSVKTVGTGEIGVVTSFGRVTGRELSEGLNLVAPWPFNSVWIADVKVQKEEAGASAASQDLQEVKSTVVLNYHLDRNSVDTVYQHVGTDYRARIIDPALQETFKATTAQYAAADLITKRNEVKEGVKKQLTDRLGKYGIDVDDISITNFDFSDDFNKAIEGKQVAQQQAEQAKFNLQKAQLDAQDQEVQKASLSPEILQKMAIERWDGHLPQYLGAGNVFGIPLSK